MKIKLKKKHVIKLTAFCFFMLLLVPTLILAANQDSNNPTLTSTADDQTNIEVTVYNSNLGLVKDTRNIKLNTGIGELRFMDVAASIKPVTVKAVSVNMPGAFTVLEQNYEYDLMNANKLLDKYVGKKIKLIDRNIYKNKEKEIEATLLSNNQGQVYKIGDEIYLGHPGYKVLPELPEDLIAKPTLMWLYDNSANDPHDLEVSYLTNNINWKADYVLTLGKDDKKADLSGWVTVDNRSGTTYRDATLKLVAGEVNRAEPEGRVMYKRKMDFAMAESMRAPQFTENSFFEYHIYDLERKTTIKDKQTKQINLLEATDIDIEKELLVYGMQSYFTRRYRQQNPKQPVNVYVKLKNSKKNNLGMPLPKGIMRLYKEDHKGSLQFIGEDRIEHTPKDEEVRLKIGEAFDVVAERIQTDYKVISSRVHESEWEITLKNHKKEDITVGIIEPLYSDWRVINKTHPYKKIDAFTLRFDVPVKKDEEVKVKYRIRVTMPK